MREGSRGNPHRRSVLGRSSHAHTLCKMSGSSSSCGDDRAAASPLQKSALRAGGLSRARAGFTKRERDARRLRGGLGLSKANKIHSAEGARVHLRSRRRRSRSGRRTRSEKRASFRAGEKRHRESLSSREDACDKKRSRRARHAWPFLACEERERERESWGSERKRVSLLGDFDLGRLPRLFRAVTVILWERPRSAKPVPTAATNARSHQDEGSSTWAPRRRAS